MSKCFIFAGGELGEIKKCDIEEGSYIICADSGLCHAQKLEIAPDVILGDFDSYKGELNYDVEIIRCSPQKDDTDTLMAVKLAISRGYDDIIILGALGGRFDHTIANIQTLKYAIEHNVKAEIKDGRNRIFMLNSGEYEFEKTDDYFSIFAFSESIKISFLKGVKYPLENYTIYQNFPIGASNEIISEKAVLNLTDGTALVIFAEA